MHGEAMVGAACLVLLFVPLRTDLVEVLFLVCEHHLVHRLGKRRIAGSAFR